VASLRALNLLCRFPAVLWDLRSSCRSCSISTRLVLAHRGIGPQCAIGFALGQAVASLWAGGLLGWLPAVQRVLLGIISARLVLAHGNVLSVSLICVILG